MLVPQRLSRSPDLVDHPTPPPQRAVPPEQRPPAARRLDDASRLAAVNAEQGRDLSALRFRVRKLEERVETLRAERDAARHAVNAAHDDIARMHQTIADLRRRLGSAVAA